MGNIKQMSITIRTYYFFNNINIKNVESNLLKIDKKSYKIIGIYYNGYIAIKNVGDYESIRSVNRLYLIIGKVDRHIKEKSGSECLLFASTGKNKEVLTKYIEIWDGIKNLVEKINDKPGEYGKVFMKIKFNSDDDLPLNKILKLHDLTITVRSIFQ